jgi:hypothetical protein
MGGHTMKDKIMRLAFEQHRANQDAIEAVCEASLRTRHGVKVKYLDDGGVIATVDPEVPFGTIQYGPMLGGGR